MFDTCDKYNSRTIVIFTLASLGRKTYTRARIIFIALVSQYPIKKATCQCIENAFN